MHLFTHIEIDILYIVTWLHGNMDMNQSMSILFQEARVPKIVLCAANMLHNMHDARKRNYTERNRSQQHMDYDILKRNTNMVSLVTHYDTVQLWSLW